MGLVAGRVRGVVCAGGGRCAQIGGHGGGDAHAGGFGGFAPRAFDDFEEELFEVFARVIEFGLCAERCAERIEHAAHGGGFQFCGEPDARSRADFEEVLDGSAGLHLSVIENHDAIADVFHIGEEMGGKQNGFSALRECDDEVLHLVAADGVEARGGFVEDDEVGIVDERLGQSDAPHHSFGELADRSPSRVSEADHFEELCDARAAHRRGEVEKFAVEVERFLGGQIGVEIGFLGEIAHARLGLHIARVLSQNAEGALGGVEEAEQHLDGGAFAGAVWAEEAEDFAPPHFEGDLLHCGDFRATPEIAEVLCQAVGLDDGGFTHVRKINRYSRAINGRDALFLKRVYRRANGASKE